MQTRTASRYLVGEFHRGYRLDRFLQAMIPKLSRARVQAAIRSRVAVSWHPRPRPSLRVVPGGEVRIFFPEIVEPPVTVRPSVLYEDAAILVAEKPAGLLVHPTHSTLRNTLIHILREERPGAGLSLAHRLDRDTSGLILLTKTAASARSLARQFEAREVDKSYLAIVHGRLRPGRGRLDSPLGVTRRLQVVFKRSPEGDRAQAAVTDFVVLGRAGEISLVRLFPRTGRRHQLRAHLASIGHPIVGDRLYGLSDREFLRHLRGKLDEEREAALLAPRQLLHAASLGFVHPLTGAPVSFTSPLPRDMREFLTARGLSS
jgi:23S rRNA pseudouridine1911/1915/1917 synthase